MALAFARRLPGEWWLTVARAARRGSPATGDDMYVPTELSSKLGADSRDCERVSRPERQEVEGVLLFESST